MAKKAKRAKKVSSGVGKNRSGKNVPRRTPVSINYAAEEQVRQEDNRRWPTQQQEIAYFELNMAKDKQRGPGRIKPPELGFYLLESVAPATLDKLLTAASLTVKRVRRYPNWILQQTYNLRNRPIEFI